MNAIPLIASCALLALVSAAALAADAPAPVNSTVLGGPDQQLIAGAEALRRGEHHEGVALTIEGLKQPNSPRDVAAALSNLCAGYTALRQFTLALQACDESLQIDRANWRTWNNRAAAHLGQGRHDAALVDVQTGLMFAPNSDTLRRTRSIVESHKRAREEGVIEGGGKVIKT